MPSNFFWEATKLKPERLTFNFAGSAAGPSNQIIRWNEYFYCLLTRVFSSYHPGRDQKKIIYCYRGQAKVIVERRLEKMVLPDAEVPVCILSTKFYWHGGKMYIA